MPRKNAARTPEKTPPVVEEVDSPTPAAEPSSPAPAVVKGGEEDGPPAVSWSTVVVREVCILVALFVVMCVPFVGYDMSAALPIVLENLGLYVSIRVAVATVVFAYRTSRPVHELLSVVLFLAFMYTVFVWRPSLKPVAAWLDSQFGPAADKFFRDGFKNTRHRFLLGVFIVFAGLVVHLTTAGPLWLLAIVVRAIRRMCGCRSTPAVFGREEQAEQQALEAESGEE